MQVRFLPTPLNFMETFPMTDAELQSLKDYLQSMAVLVAGMDGVRNANDCTFGITVRANGSHYFSSWSGVESAIGETTAETMESLRVTMGRRLDRARNMAAELGYDLVPREMPVVIEMGEPVA